jgi:hypothetical protein
MKILGVLRGSLSYEVIAAAKIDRIFSRCQYMLTTLARCSSLSSWSCDPYIELVREWTGLTEGYYRQRHGAHVTDKP